MKERYHVFVARSHADETWVYQGGDFDGHAEDAASRAIATAREPGTGDDGPFLFVADRDDVAFAFVVPQHGDRPSAWLVEAATGDAHQFPTYWLAACPPGIDPVQWAPEDDAVAMHAAAYETMLPPYSEVLADRKRLMAGLEAISASGGKMPDEHLTRRVAEMREAVEEAVRLLRSAEPGFAGNKAITLALSELERAVPDGLNA